VVAGPGASRRLRSSDRPITERRHVVGLLGWSGSGGSSFGLLRREAGTTSTTAGRDGIPRRRGYARAGCATRTGCGSSGQGFPSLRISSSTTRPRLTPWSPSTLSATGPGTARPVGHSCHPASRALPPERDRSSHGADRRPALTYGTRSRNSGTRPARDTRKGNEIIRLSDF
jgi:hypothetical protein